MLTEKRGKSLSIDDCFRKLSLAQEMALMESFQLGFLLIFIRKIDGELIAVANKGHKFITIDHSGIANYKPDLILRNSLG